jgi:hypothetical protein
MRLKKLAEQYRKNAKEVLSNPENYDDRTLWQASILLQRDIEKALTTLARRNDGCISCANSKPHEKKPLDITTRTCELGIEGNCKSWQPILSGEG